MEQKFNLLAVYKSTTIKSIFINQIYQPIVVIYGYRC